MTDQVAIVGMSIRTAGAADPAAFWRLLAEGRSGRRELDQAELARRGVPYRTYSHPQYVPVAYPLADPLTFDAAAFGFSAGEAALTDPQHRAMLQACYRAVESAGHHIADLRGQVGLYVGTRIGDHGPMLRGRLRHTDSALDETWLVTGNNADFLATRIAYCFGLTGPAISVQTACSTSGVAIHLASQAILAGECDAAVAGGTAIDLEDAGYFYSEGGVFSPRGRCEPFTVGADGTVDGNGIAALFLKRLDAAVDDGDPILGVIAATVVNSDGRDRAGYTAPSVSGQSALIAEALDVAGLRADRIGMFETHGTGTAVGDPLEIEAATLAFREAGATRGDIRLSAIKANVGHLTAASGAAGAIACLLALRHERIPPNLPIVEGAAAIDLGGSPFRLSGECQPWPRGAEPRYAAVSNFGLGGTNAHLIIGDPPAGGSPVRGKRRAWQLLPLSADDPERLAETSAAFAEAVTAGGPEQRHDLGHTLRTGRPALAVRAVAVVPAEGEVPRSAWPGPESFATAPATTPAVVYLLPGQGVLKDGAPRQLYGADPAFTGIVDEGMDVVAEAAGGRTADQVRSAFTEGRLTPDTRVAQPALHLLASGVHAALAAAGVHPDAIAGHSVGELTGACLAGVLTFADATEAICRRAEAMAAMPAGSMLLVRAGQELLRDLPEDACVSVVNSPTSTAISYGPEAASRLLAWLDHRGLTYRPLDTSHAFHHPGMAPAAAHFAARLPARVLHAPRIPLISCRSGEWLRPEEATDPGYWGAQLREPVEFARALRTVAGAYPTALYVQLSLGSGLLRAARQGGVPAENCVPVLPEEPADHPAALVPRAVGELWRRGCAVDWSVYSAADRGLRTEAPPRTFLTAPVLHPALEDLRRGIDPYGTRPRPRTEPEPAADAQDGEIAELLEAVRDWWEQILGARPEPDEDFFTAGGDSIAAAQLVARLRPMFDVDIPVHLPLTATTPRALARAVDELLVAVVTGR
ncbi:type I polyketide synthase [Nonomuraea diastatica]|uniref:Type I polyketide synthase n=1 Tax=Nonomuraea diastatica TaxID=1848329 RepID=A0A4R4WUD1_9ACTN|nr:type I polyketide synthase [Nonomuraea diastatica]TDD21246.1 type I polyketide synthase [Nonomuraea diastatica]